MRIPLLISLAALALTAQLAHAQAPQTPRSAEPPQQAAPAPTETPRALAAGRLGGAVEIGGQFTATDGDTARYERLRDMSNGAYSSITLARQTGASRFDASLFHIGYRDQRHSATFMNRRLNLGFDWVSQPLNYFYDARTAYVTNGNLLSLPDAAQAAVQGPTFAPADGLAVGVPCAPGAPPAACSTPALAAQAKANRSIYNGLARTFELRQRRDTGAAAFTYAMNRSVDIDAHVRSWAKTGEQPWGASFAFNNAVELPQPLNQRATDTSVGATWAEGRSMFRVGWDGSFFRNAIGNITFDNPIFLNDYTNGLAPPNGPYDPSGYSNGNGPAQGRQAMAPDNTMNVVSATGNHRFALRTVVSGTAQFTDQEQNDTLIPWTTNRVIMTPQVLAAFPHLATLPRPTAEASAKGINAMLNLTSRPYRPVTFNVRYRFNRRDVQTPLFDATEYVRFDAVPEEIEEGFSPQFDNSRHLFDANIAYTPLNFGTLRAGYGHEAIRREGRGFADVGEHIFRVSWDTYTSQYVTVRASFDAGRRRGEGVVETHPVVETEDLLFITGEGGTQPTLRYYDEADRDRTRGSVVVSVMPRDSFDVFLQFAGSRDKYLPDNSVPLPANRLGEYFGLQRSTNTSWNGGMNLHAGDVVSFGASYGRDRFGSFQRSRASNPPPDPSWIDPNRDWTLDNGDEISNVNVFLDLLNLGRTDVRLNYDFSDSNNSFTFGGPRIPALAALGQFIPLPDVDNSWHRFRADVTRMFTARAGLGVGYYFETLDIADWNTIDTNGPVTFAPATGTPRIDWLGELNTGYGNRPYTGHTGYLRLVYRF